jgi:signal transduction histidine kinase
MEMSSTGKPSHHLKIIQQSAERGASLLRQMLMFARGADGAFEPVALAFIISEIATMISETFDRNFTVSVEVAPDIPVIQADPTQLHQIIMNLCVNARDAMENGGHIAISARALTLSAHEIPTHELDAKPGAYVMVAVSDNGPGIPPEIRRRLFEPFFTTKPPGKGTGLGLATVLRLVKRHGGFVTLESEVGKGASFRCMLPA